MRCRRIDEAPAVLVARRRPDYPTRHVVVRVDRVEQVRVAAVHRVVHIMRPAVVHRVRHRQLPVTVKVVVLEAPLDALAHEEAVEPLAQAGACLVVDHFEPLGLVLRRLLGVFGK